MTVPPTGYPIVFPACDKRRKPTGRRYWIRAADVLHPCVKHANEGYTHASWRLLDCMQDFHRQDRDKLRIFHFWLPNRCV